MSSPNKVTELFSAELKELKIAPKSALIFKRGGQHIMLIGLKQSLENGTIIPIELVFQDKSAHLKITVDNDRPIEHSSHKMSH